MIGSFIAPIIAVKKKKYTPRYSPEHVGHFFLLGAILLWHPLILAALFNLAIIVYYISDKKHQSIEPTDDLNKYLSAFLNPNSVIIPKLPSQIPQRIYSKFGSAPFEILACTFGPEVAATIIIEALSSSRLRPPGGQAMVKLEALLRPDFLIMRLEKASEVRLHIPGFWTKPTSVETSEGYKIYDGNFVTVDNNPFRDAAIGRAIASLRDAANREILLRNLESVGRQDYVKPSQAHSSRTHSTPGADRAKDSAA